MKQLHVVFAGMGIGSLVLAVSSLLLTPSFVPDVVSQKSALPVRAANPGTCLAGNSTGQPSAVVNCSAEHVFEIAAVVDLRHYPGIAFHSTAYPSAQQISVWNDQICSPVVRQYLDSRYDIHGRYKIGALLSSVKSWSQGDHFLQCGLETPGGNRSLLSSTGDAAHQDQSLTYDTGVCVGAFHNMPTVPVECSQPHAFEVVGQSNLDIEFPDQPLSDPPSAEEQNARLKLVCEKAAEDYVSSVEKLRSTTLDVNWTVIKPQSWFAGSRKTVCFVGKHHDRGFALLEGSVKQDILVDHSAPVVPPKPTRRTPGPLAPPARPPE